MTSRSSTSSRGPVPGEQIRLHRGAERDDLIGIDVGERLLAEELRHVGAAPRGTRVEPPTRITPSSSSGFEARVAQRAPARDARCARAAARSSSSKCARVEQRTRRCRRRAGSSTSTSLASVSACLTWRAASRASRTSAGVRASRVVAAHARGASPRRARDPCRRRRARCRRRSTCTWKTPSSSDEDGDVERAAAEIVDREHAVLLLLEAVGERRRGGLVEQAQHLEPGEPPGVLRGLALRVVEVRGHRDDRAADAAAARPRRVCFRPRRISALTSTGVTTPIAHREAHDVGVVRRSAARRTRTGRGGASRDRRRRAP